MNIKDIQTLRNTVLIHSKPTSLRESSIARMKKSGGSLRKATPEFLEAKSKMKGSKPSSFRTRKVKRESIKNKTTTPMQEASYSLWMEDVNEAVDQFIGMPIDVLPRMPWKTWFRKGLSAVVAAKNAVQMYEDIDEDDEGFEEEEEEEEEEELDEGLSGFVLALPYHKWYGQIDGLLQKSGLSFEALKVVSNINNAVIHGWYNANYAVENTFKMIMEQPAAKKAKQYTKKTLKSAGGGKPNVSESVQEGYVDILGVPMRVKPLGTPLREAMKVPTETPVIPKPVAQPRQMGSGVIDETQEIIDSSMVAEAAAACTDVISEEKQEKQAAISQGKRPITVPNQQTGNEIVPKPKGGGMVENVNPDATESEEG